MAVNTTADVLIVGGGIGGLSTAFALTRQGLAVRVPERSTEFGEVGAGIQLAPNDTRILHDYGLLEEAARLGVVPSRTVMRDAVDGHDLTALDLADLGRTYGFPYLVIHRSDLHGLFLRTCRRAGVLTNHTLEPTRKLPLPRRRRHGHAGRRQRTVRTR